MPKILMNPWDFTVYKTRNNDYVLKIMFSEGEYKIDIARFFYFRRDEIKSPEDFDSLSKLSETIRIEYSKFAKKEISKDFFDVII